MNFAVAPSTQAPLPGTPLARALEDYRSVPAIACFVVLAAAVFSGPVDIAEGVTSELQTRVARTPSLALKLSAALAAGAIGAWGVVCLPRVRAILLTLPGVTLCAIAALFLLTSITAITSGSIPIALVFLAYLTFTPTCLLVLGLRGVMASVLLGLFAFTVGALLLYVFMPNYGVFAEEFGDGVIVERLGGMSQPNHTGRSAMLGLLIAIYFMKLPRAPRWLCFALCGVFILAGLLAMSRTALVAGAVSLVIVNLDWVLTRAGIVVTCFIATLGLGTIFGLAAAGHDELIAQKLLGTFTKTGDVEEFTSLTGRSEIWARTIALIEQRPLHGWGMGANKIVLVDHLQSTHNILLHPTLAAGVGAGLLTFLLLVWNLFNVFSYPPLLIRALSAFVLISGLSEDTIYETFPGACTLLWLTCCLWPMMVPHRAPEPVAG